MNNIHSEALIGENKSPTYSLLSLAGVNDNEHLTKIHASGKPNRIMAFFTPEICLTSQVGHNDSVTHLTPFTGLNRHILGQPQFEDIPSYGGVTLQNRKAERQICRAVACVTESEPRHPIYGVVLTQNNTQGGHTHAL